MHRRVVFISAAVIVVLLANCQMQIANIESGAVALPNSQHTVAELFNMNIYNARAVVSCGVELAVTNPRLKPKSLQ